ncbi:hypothetical protein EMIHUDRAFT_103216 [Emiliania huxleyi CCMP1516]|uniref:GST N-terminal domain-containing protein n=2 Tax=Emiliania huxleyi TaxID=2903 RepID=A0A0D3IWS2_EMIH1|nr:hypothetical protein EMIHUDRAFT_103216 [Emiliania huxleyi CCMP1516]EOD15707.1 hypothetical protein EMIHUDRAFT_103216 [Emiliania huxleyi CCMP1516]|eukprot:XP_005768136.1 hypothetical protein EMIHUDRAFT_103216 [Emiliania huxleyi CCMP1516]
MADTLIYVPTNNCARVMIFLRLNGLEHEVSIKSPFDYGGLDTDAYRAINPMAKLPALITSAGDTVFESQVIVEYLADKYSRRLTEPCLPSTLEARTKAFLLGARTPPPTPKPTHHVRGAMYKEKMPLEERKGRAADLWKQLEVIEGLLDSDGPFAAGELSLADCALYPTYVFVVELAPISLGWEKPFDKLEKTKKWFAFCEAHEVLGVVGADVHALVKKILTAQAEGVAKQVADAEGMAEGLKALALCV